MSRSALALSLGLGAVAGFAACSEDPAGPVANLTGVCELTSTTVTEVRIEGDEFCTLNTGTQTFVLTGAFSLQR